MAVGGEGDFDGESGLVVEFVGEGFTAFVVHFAGLGVAELLAGAFEPVDLDEVCAGVVSFFLRGRRILPSVMTPPEGRPAEI